MVNFGALRSSVSANGPKVRWLAAAVAALPARVRAPSGRISGCVPGLEGYRGACVQVCGVCACVNSGRRVLGFLDSP